MSKSTSPAPKPRGRPRSPDVHSAILAAAFDLMIERGYAAMAIEAVAARAGVGKATVYRHWPGRPELAVEAFFSATRTQLEFPDTGSTQEDFRQQIQQVAAILRGRTGAAMAAMIAGALTEPALARALGERWVTPRMRWGAARMAAAVKSGEARPDLDIPAALAALYAPLYARLCFGLPAMTTQEVTACSDIVLAGIFRPRTTG